MCHCRMDGLKEEESYYSKTFCAAPAKWRSNMVIITLYDLGQHSIYQSATCNQLSVSLTLSGGFSMVVFARGLSGSRGMIISLKEGEETFDSPDVALLHLKLLV